jgi:L-threonylcarbamoyladenylate synthase
MLLSDLEFLIDKIQTGSVCVLPTDTIYGIVGTVNQPDAVERIYKIKNRPLDNPCILLISDLSQLQQFSIELDQQQIETLDSLWPAPVSVILPCPDEAYAYLHRGKQSLAFRIPDNVWLREVIHKTGPIIATSANKTGSPITSDLDEIMKQLPSVDFFIEGPVSQSPSKLCKLHEDGSIEWLQRS